jgi:putative two-component system response regulator
MSEKKKTVLIADDAKINRQILVRALQEEYNILEAEDGSETLQQIVKHYKEISVVLLDINMPKINGFQVMDVLNKKHAMKYIPIILITGENSDENMRKGYEYGAVEFISKPFNPQVVKNCIANVVKIYGEKKHLEMLTIQQNKRLLEQAERLKNLNSNIMDMLGSLVEFRGSESNNHIKRVKEFTRILCQSLAEYFPDYKLDEEKIEYITSASSMHDIGKIMIPDTILLKPSKLTEEEYEIMKSHTTKGCELLNSTSEYQDDMYAKYSYEICRYHHERHDGNGYPEGLKGDEIPISAQVVSIAEAFDALMTNSIYRRAIPFEKAFAMITEGDCGMFAPELIQCFMNDKEKFMEIDEKYSDKSFL